MTAIDPAPPPPGYARVAVAQIEYRPAALLGPYSPLEHPTASLEHPNSFPFERNEHTRHIAARFSTLQKKLRADYVQQITLKTQDILAQCARWHVDFAVFPEYSIPFDSIQNGLILPPSVCVVLGSHRVERAFLVDSCYTSFGLPAPAMGQAVAPIARGGSLVAFHPKLQAAPHFEEGLSLGKSWVPFDHEKLTKVTKKCGVLICVDFIQRQDDPWKDLVLPRLNECGLVFVPALTPPHTTAAFLNFARQDRRNGHFTAFSNHTPGGGSTIVPPLRKHATEPPEIPVGEEGLLVVDIDLAPAKSSGDDGTTFSWRPPWTLVAQASLLYRAFPSCDPFCDLLSRLRVLPEEDAARLLRDSLSILSNAVAESPRSRQGRLLALVDDFDKQPDNESLWRLLRDVELTPTALPLAAIREAQVRYATAEIGKWMGSARDDHHLTPVRSFLAGLVMP